ncbi:SusD/RagB family nutrient-binding outer membrane lipoprotein [soil metagenome]
MKKIIFKSFLAASTALVLLSGCKKFEDFGDRNVNPNGTTVPVTSALLTQAEIQLGDYAGRLTNMRIRPGLYVQYFSETQYTDVSLYNLPQIDFGGIYAGPIKDLQNIIDVNSNPATSGTALLNGANENQIGIAKILKSYYIWGITDAWGDVPYSDALSGNPYPKYDKQEDIYKGMIADLKSAVTSMNASATPVIKGDVIYAGNIAKWKKLANSMRMLMALRLSKVYPAAGGYAQVEFAAAAADAAGSISVNADNFIITYPGGSFNNPYYSLLTGRKDYGEAKTYVDILTALGDNRLTVTGTSTVAADAFPYGLKRDQAVLFEAAHPNYPQVLAASQRTSSSPFTMISASFVLFARAEAAERGWTSENAATLYAQAVQLSFERWGLTLPSGYMSNASVTYVVGDQAGNLMRIAIQRYIDLYPDGAQAWAEWRRTGFPVLTPTPNATNTSKQIPRRYVYGLNEFSLNPASLAEAIARLAGGDTQDSRVWWDKP